MPTNAELRPPAEGRPRASVRLIEERDWPRVHELYGRVFGEGPLALWRNRWQWQFIDNPATRFRASRFWVAVLDDEPAGFLASYPTRFQIRDQEVTVLSPCDLLVSPSAGGHGFGLHLINAYLGTQDNVLPHALQYSLGNGLIHDRLEYRKMWIQPVSVRPYNIPALGRIALRSVGGRLGRAARAAALLGLPAANVVAALARVVAAPRASRKIALETVKRPGAEFDTLWERLRRDYPVVVVRDKAWVTWRFADDPHRKHDLILAREGSGTPVGYVALSDWVWHDRPVGRIMDLFAPPGQPDVIRTLLAAALDHFEARKVDIVSCLGLHPAARSVVRRYLFVTPPRLSVSARVRWNGDPAAVPVVFDEASWHLSYADGDDAFG